MTLEELKNQIRAILMAQIDCAVSNASVDKTRVDIAADTIVDLVRRFNRQDSEPSDDSHKEYFGDCCPRN
jgi:hypothetical protein